MRLFPLLTLFGAGLAACRPEPMEVGTLSGAAPLALPAATATLAPGVPAVAFYDVGVRPRAIATGFLDGDRTMDVAVANSDDGTISVLFGDAAGKLGGRLTFAAGQEPSDVDVLDLDLDGDVDLVVANHETPLVTVLSNDGRGRFSAASGSPFDTGARPHIHGVATGDFDGDGWPDVAVESADTREVRILRGGERGLAPAIAVAIGTMPYSRLGVGEVTGDGRLDVLVPGHGDQTVRAIESRAGVFSLAATTIRLAAQPWMIVAGDVNGDRRDDLFVVETGGTSLWLAGAAGWAPAPGSPFPVRGATEAAVGDLDGDGAADVAIGPWDGDEVTLLLARATVTRKIRICERPIGLAISDLSGDGRGELLVTCTNANKLAVVTFSPR